MKIIERCYEELKYVFDPELAVNIVDLGLIDHIDLTDDHSVTVTMNVLEHTKKDDIACLVKGVKYALRFVDGIEKVKVNIVSNPSWTPERMNEQMKKQLIG
ncbi:metal-sulfur cluster assembly factor [Fervidibacillus halotolerans]|uniref:Iron-sulfur cluster assembly protein n=1 Tax=Fervidibacillus halotolerans TaxID=2980027 RepID=A0A9E8M0L2_9BACI|nr:iron-sulfur cluster assembly protein [Fervidibacillus halotolerans]WAA13303.1 iron-sulfur cluster assembly protein [Fervidibacillus halotolerans]